MAILTPPGWIADQVDRGMHALGAADAHDYWHHAAGGTPVVQPIGLADVAEALRRGIDDFKTARTDVLFLCVFYPVVGLLLARVASGYNLIPLLFPLASGFALVGPFAAVGLNEMSRLREDGVQVSWIHAFNVLRAPSLGAIILLGLFQIVLLGTWLGMADLIYRATLGPDYPLSVSDFLGDVFGTDAGWTMILIGVSVGFAFALLVLVTSVVSFPVLLDRKVGVVTAIVTSAQVVRRNPLPALAWGAIVAAGLILASIPLLLGLVVVMPILGHATWHLYRRVVAWEDDIED